MALRWLGARRGPARLPVAIGVVAVFTMLVHGVGCGSQSHSTSKGTDASRDKLAIHALPWKVTSVKWPRTVTVFVEVSSCGGGSEARILPVRPLYAGRRIYILTEVGFPKVRRPKGVACAGVELSAYKTIRLEHDLHGAKLYDLSTNPPTLRWP